MAYQGPGADTDLAYITEAPFYSNATRNQGVRGRIVEANPRRRRRRRHRLTLQQQRQRQRRSAQTALGQRHVHRSKAEIHAPSCACEFCICTVCNCGRHKCPDSPSRAHYDRGLKSNYAANFSGHAGAVPATSQRPATQPLVDENRPFQGTTSYMRSFVDHGPCAGVRASAMPRVSRHTGSNSKLESMTQHRRAFQQWNVKPSKSCRPVEVDPTVGELGRRRIEDKRSFVSEARAQFADKHATTQVRSGFKPVPRAHVLSAKFQGVSTHQDLYRDWLSQGARPSRSAQTMQVLQRFPDHRSFETEHRSGFYKKSVRQCPARAVAVTKKMHRGHVCLEPAGFGQYRLVADEEGRVPIW